MTDRDAPANVFGAAHIYRIGARVRATAARGPVRSGDEGEVTDLSELDGFVIVRFDCVGPVWWDDEELEETP